MILEDLNISKTFQEGMHFTCEKCGACCRGLNEGEVYVYMDDILRLIEFLEFRGESYTLREFASNFLKITSQYFQLYDPESGEKKRYTLDTLGLKFTGEDDHCFFINEDNSCSVHEARPFQCQAFPIGWKMLMNNDENLVEYSKKCQGLKNSLKNKGKFYSVQEIMKWTQGEYKIEYEYFILMKNNNFDIFKIYDFLPRDIDC